MHHVPVHVHFFDESYFKHILITQTYYFYSNILLLREHITITRACYDRPNT